MNAPSFTKKAWALALAFLAFAAPASAQFKNSVPSLEGLNYAEGDEQQLIETLRTAAPEEKAIACKQLAIHGTKAAVPELAKLLADPQLASWARIALEAITDPAADEALLKAAETLDGRLLVGTLNSIGVRRYAPAVDHLSQRLKHNDAEVASAAAVALGRIANAPATNSLKKSLASSRESVRSAVAEGLILCAERLLADGNTDEAAALYDEVRKADVPKPRALEATRGAIVARQAGGIPLLVEQLKSDDKAFFYIGLSTSRELASPEVAVALAAQLPGAAPDRAAALLASIADRDNATLLPAVLEAAKSGDKQVRIAAIGVVGRSTDASTVPTLLEIAADPDAELANAAKASLAGLAGEKINDALVARLSETNGKALAALIEVIGQRRVAATPALIKAAENADPAVRNAALVALGETVGPEEMYVLIEQVVSPKEGADVGVAVQALRAACVRMPDRDACAAELAAAISDAPATAKIAILETLGAMGGPKALETITAAVKGGDAPLYDAGTRVLGEWMTVDAAPALLDMATDPANKKFQVRALRGYLRLARQFPMPDEARAEMCKQALAAASRVEEQKLVMDIVARYPSYETLAIALRAKEQMPEIRKEASRAAMVIARKFIDEGADSKEVLAKIGVKPVDVEIVKAVYGSGDAVRDVTQALQQQVRGLPLITLSAASFNKSFGGDPAPNMPKELKVQYRMNGKAGDVSFPENAVIVLPMPE